MTFRKDILLFVELQIMSILFAILSLWQYLILDSVLMICLGFIFCIILILNVILHNEYITIDETGISCKKANNSLWCYAWSDIEALRHSRRSNQPSMEIILKDETDCIANRRKQASGYYFQVGHKAKQAIKLYCPCPIEPYWEHPKKISKKTM